MLPERYVRADAERPHLDEVVVGANIPVVELANRDRAAVVSDTDLASSFGFRPFSDDRAKKMRVSKRFNVRNWRDFIRPYKYKAANPPPFSCQPDEGPLDRCIEEAGCSQGSTGGAGGKNFGDCLAGYQADERPLDRCIEDAGCSQGSGGGCLAGPLLLEPVMKPSNDIPIFLPSEPVMKSDDDSTIFLPPEPANMDMTPQESTNVDTSTGLPEVSANVGVTSPELPPEVSASMDVNSLDLEVGISQIMQSVIPRESAPTREQVATSLSVISFLTALCGLTAMFHLPAEGPVFGHYKDSYYIILAIALVAAAVELATSYWLTCSNGQRILKLARAGLPIAYLLLLIVFATGGFVIPFGKAHPAR